MAAVGTKGRYPQDIVAIFHASFHPTRGHVVDWSLKASDDLNLDNVEFSALPSGLHLVDQDVVYFTKDEQRGVCVFRRRKTVEEGHRGFHLSSLGILLAKSSRPRPWLHTLALKELMTRIFSQPGVSTLTENQWEPARAFFDERKVRRADLGGAGDWTGWSNEFDEIETSNASPTLHLPHLLRILGPSSLTLYKYVLARRRILIYTLPPVEAACILCQVAADMCYETQQQHDTSSDHNNSHLPRRLKARCKEAINVLGMVTLNDTDRLRSETQNGRGWIACTTDAIFLEKPSYYDLLIDLTTSTPSKATRPTFYISKPIPQPSGSRGPTHRLSTIRFSWSDIKLWNELDRILRLDSEHKPSSHYNCCTSMPSSSADIKSRIVTTWTDAWRVYEDVCVICAGLWVGSWRNNSTMSYSTAGGAENWGKVRLEGDDDLSLSGGAHIRNLGMGIEGGPPVAGGSQIAVNGDTLTAPSTTNRGMRRTSGMSWSSGKATVVSPPSVAGGSVKARQASMSTTVANEGDDEGTRDGQMLTTLSLLQTLHAHTLFQLSVLESFIPRAPSQSESELETVYLAPKDIGAFELSPLSALDAKYLEWLVLEYAGTTRVVVKRGWRDLLGAIFGYA